MLKPDQARNSIFSKSHSISLDALLTFLFLSSVLLNFSYPNIAYVMPGNNDNQLVRASTQSADGFLTIYNPDAGLIMQYPSNWNLVDEGSYEISLKPSDLTEDEFAFFKLTINFLDISSLDEYANSQVSELVNFGAMAEEVSELESDVVDGNPAYYVLYSDEYFSGFQQYVVYENMGYTFDYSADHSLYDKYLPLAEQIIYGVQLFEPPVESSDSHASPPLLADLPGPCRLTPEGKFQICY